MVKCFPQSATPITERFHVSYQHVFRGQFLPIVFSRNGDWTGGRLERRWKEFYCVVTMGVSSDVYVTLLQSLSLFHWSLRFPEVKWRRPLMALVVFSKGFLKHQKVIESKYIESVNFTWTCKKSRRQFKSGTWCRPTYGVSLIVVRRRFSELLMTGVLFESMMIKRKEPLVAHVLGLFEMIRCYAHEMYYIITRVFQIPVSKCYVCFLGSKWYASSQGVWQSLGNLMRSFSRDTCCMPMMHLSLRTFGFNNTNLLFGGFFPNDFTYSVEFVVRSRDLFKASLKSMQWLLLRNGRSDFQHHAFTGRANSSWSQFHAGTVGDDQTNWVLGGIFQVLYRCNYTRLYV